MTNVVNRTPEEHKLITEIAARAVRVATRMKRRVDQIDLMMDLSACHANGCPLKLKELADADEFNFIHDIFGIQRHLDRKTGKLTGFFSPRFTDTEAKKAWDRTHRPD